MSYYSDFSDNYYELEQGLSYLDNIRESLDNGEWKTKEGNYLKINEMSTSHILNVIKLLRNLEIEEHYINILQRAT